MRAHHSPQAQDFSPWQPNGWRTYVISRLHTSFVTMSEDWQGSMGRRMNEDLHLWQELAGAKSPHAMWSAYSGSWQEAVADYWKEYATLAKISGTLIEDITAVHETSEGPSSHAKAA
jgi:hypothetical protein